MSVQFFSRHIDCVVRNMPSKNRLIQDHSLQEIYQKSLLSNASQLSMNIIKIFIFGSGMFCSLFYDTKWENIVILFIKWILTRATRVSKYPVKTPVQGNKTAMVRRFDLAKGFYFYFIGIQMMILLQSRCYVWCLDFHFLGKK